MEELAMILMNVRSQMESALIVVSILQALIHASAKPDMN